jgi:hypothetical protein
MNFTELTGLLFLLITLFISVTSLILLVIYFNEFIKLNYIQKITIITAINISLASHSALSYTFKQTYGYNPIEYLNLLR